MVKRMAPKNRNRLRLAKKQTEREPQKRWVVRASFYSAITALLVHSPHDVTIMRSARTHESVPVRIFRSTREAPRKAARWTKGGTRMPSAAHSRQFGVPTHLTTACSARESGYSSAAETTGLPEISSTKIAPIAHDAHGAPSGARYREDLLLPRPTKHRTPPPVVTRTESACTANSTNTDLQNAYTSQSCATMASRARHEPTRPTRA